MFYMFRQNNSGGDYKEPANIVIIEANTAKQANQIALDNNIYFDGVVKHIDCACCGDRWSECFEHEAEPEPICYGEKDLQISANEMARFFNKWHIRVIYLNGYAKDYHATYQVS